MGFTRFEDIDAWKQARELTQSTFAFTRASATPRIWAVVDHLERSAVSCMNNIAEGFGRCSDAEFARFLWIAAGSAREVQSTLYAASDAGMIWEGVFSELYAKAESVANMSASLARYLQKPRLPSDSRS